MKTFRNYLMMLGLAIFAVLASGCSKDGSEELGYFIQMDNAVEFISKYKGKGNKAVLLDVRNKTQFEKDGLPGAINVSIMKGETNDPDAKYLDTQFASDVVKAVGDKTKFVFIYGNPSFAWTRDIAGHVSKAGFGHDRTIIYIKDYEVLKSAFNELQ